jgi:hypothetical protein
MFIAAVRLSHNRHILTFLTQNLSFLRRCKTSALRRLPVDVWMKRGNDALQLETNNQKQHLIIDFK